MINNPFQGLRQDSRASNRTKSVNNSLSLVDIRQFGMITSGSKESLRGVAIDKAESHGDFPEGHPSWYYSRPSTFNFGVLVDFDVLVLVRSCPL